MMSERKTLSSRLSALAEQPQLSWLTKATMLEAAAHIGLLSDARAAHAAEVEGLRAENARLRALVLHVNNSLAGADQNTEHQIECHADTLPQYTRSLALAIEVAYRPVNDWIQAGFWKDEPPPMPCVDPGNDCRCLEDAEEAALSANPETTRKNDG